MKYVEAFLIFAVLALLLFAEPIIDAMYGV